MTAFPVLLDEFEAAVREDEREDSDSTNACVRVQYKRLRGALAVKVATEDPFCPSLANHGIVLPEDGEWLVEHLDGLVSAHPVQIVRELATLARSLGKRLSEAQSALRMHNEATDTRVLVLERELAAAMSERDALGKAIRDNAMEANILDADLALTGPHLIMLCQDLRELAESYKEDYDESCAVLARSNAERTADRPYAEQMSDLLRQFVERFAEFEDSSDETESWQSEALNTLLAKAIAALAKNPLWQTPIVDAEGEVIPGSNHASELAEKMPREDDAGRFGSVFIVSEDNDGKPLPFGKVAIAMNNGGWLGSSNGYPMGAPALYSEQRAQRIVEVWNCSLVEPRTVDLPELRKTWAADERKTGHICVGCDGCGWCEGSPAFKCERCNGTGIIGPNPWGLCEGCPPVGYPSNRTRCLECPRREVPSSFPASNEAQPRKETP